MLLFLSVWIAFACSEEKEIPTTEPPFENPEQNEDPKPTKADSIYYQLNVDGFELIAATEDSTCLFLQMDTTFAFRCLFDSCGSNCLLAYCDSTGLVERIVADEQIVNILHHADKKKMDIFYKDAEAKMAWIKDVDSPYKDLSSRAEGDVPYSAISIVNDLSYAVYTIINTYDVVKHKPWENFIDKYSRKEFYNTRSTVALKLITQILGKEYKVSVSNHISTIVTVMSDYSKWVREELYGTAIPHLRKYAVRETVDGLILTAYVTDVDSLSNEFAVGVIVAENGNELNGFNYLDNQSSDYNSQKINYSYSFMNPELVKKGITLVTGKDYKFIPYLAPASTSKYAIGIKSLLDCYKYGSSQTHLLLETKAEFKSMEDDQATIKLSVENADKRIKMGIIYSEHSKMLKHEYKKVEHEPTFKEGVLSNNFEKEVKIERLESGYTYYMPYVIYDDDILNRPLDYSISSETIYETDQIFYGKKDSIVSNPITIDAELNGNTLKLKGHFYTELEEDIEEYGICYNKDNKEITIENSSVLKANSHQDGNYEVSINQNEDFYYRAYIKVKDKYYYGEIKEYTQKEIKVYRCSEQDGLYLILGIGQEKLYFDKDQKWCNILLGKITEILDGVDYCDWMDYTEEKIVYRFRHYYRGELTITDIYTFKRVYNNEELLNSARDVINNTSGDGHMLVKLLYKV